MSIQPHYHPSNLFSRRQLLKWTGGLALSATSLKLLAQPAYSASKARIPPITESDLDNKYPYNPMSVLRDFNYGTVKQENGRTVREFTITCGSLTIELNRAVSFVSWNYNGQIPGSTLRAKQGDRIRVIFHNQDGHSHTMHFHGQHPADMDGIKPVRHDKTTVYEFDAIDYGVYPYHCHIVPVTRHIGKGLYGMLIIDPPQDRPPADEMVLVMGGYDLDDDGNNELYGFNGIPHYYRDRPIPIYQNQLVRIYLLNAIEFDPVATFHLHANLFQVYPTGRTVKPQLETDEITMGTMERHILEFSFSYPGRYMFHPHQDYIAEHGCMGFFEVISK